MKSFKFFFTPDYIFDSIKNITPQFLKKENIKCLIVDIDNTLVAYDAPKPDQTALNWIKGMLDEGIKISLTSNNDKERVEAFNEETKLFATYKSRKPLKRSVRPSLSYFGIPLESCAMVGDQIFTDVLVSKRVSIRAILVKPIKAKENLFFRIKRFFEKPFIREYHKKEAKRSKI